MKVLRRRRIIVILAASLGCATLLGSWTAAPTLAAGACSNEQLRIENSSTELPDCRAYEQATPPYKGAYEFVPVFISSDGSRMFAKSFATVAGSGANNSLGAAYQLDRTPSGWATTAISPPASQFPNGSFPGQLPDESADGSTIWDTGEGQDDIFLRNPEGVFTTVGPELPELATLREEHVEYVGASLGFSHILFSNHNTQDRWSFDKTESIGVIGAPSLYEYAGIGNSKPSLVGVRGGAGDDTLESRCGTSLGSRPFDVYNAISSSGETVYFTAEHQAECTGEQPPVTELYARIAGENTVAISEPTLPPGEECTGACRSAADKEGMFQGASQNGSKVFFLTEQPLLNGDEDTTMDLYEAEIEGKGKSAALSKLAQVSHDPTNGESAEVQGVARVSEDGSHVYFIAKGVLTSKPNGIGHTAVLGEPNLYVYNTETQQSAFVATLSSADSADWQRNDERPVQATPDGSFLLFQSIANLTGDAPDHTPQLYRYDASDGGLIRVSIGQEGSFNEDGATGEMATLNSSFNQADRISSGGTSISDDGSYVFFESEDGLTPQALNHVLVSNEHNVMHFAHNVYEWHDDNVYLISDGHDRTINFVNDSSVQLIGADPSGANVFFTTGDPLSPTDNDDLIDVYDARINGGFPAPQRHELCAGDTCQGPPAVLPSGLSPSTSSFSGLGNPTSSTPTTLTQTQSKKKKTAAQIKAEKLAGALRVCRSKAKSRRKGCEAAARRRYGSKSKAKKSSGKAVRS